MKSTFRTIFYLKRQVVKNDGISPILECITIDGTQTQFSCKLMANLKIGDAKTGCAMAYQWLVTKTCIVRTLIKKSLSQKGIVVCLDYYTLRYALKKKLNCRMPNGAYGGVRSGTRLSLQDKYYFIIFL